MKLPGNIELLCGISGACSLGAIIAGFICNDELMAGTGLLGIGVSGFGYASWKDYKAYKEDAEDIDSYKHKSK